MAEWTYSRGTGSSFGFRLRTSLLAPLFLRMAAVSRYLFVFAASRANAQHEKESVRTFLSAAHFRKTGILPQSNRLDDQLRHYIIAKKY